MIEKLKSIKNHRGFMKYFYNTSWLFVERIFRMSIGIFIGIWMARYLGVEKFGIFSYAQSFVGLFAAISTLGLDGIVIRELVKEKNEKVLLGTVFFLKLIGAFATLVFISIAINFTENESITNILIFIIASATIFQSFNVIDMYFQSIVLSKYIAYANIISQTISLLIKATLILYKAPLIAFAYAVLFDSIILAFWYIYFFFKYSKFTFFNFRFNRKIAIFLLKSSWPLILSGIVISIYMKIDQVMIKEMLGNKAVGLYAAAVKLSQAWYFIPMLIASSLYPAIINAKEINEKIYYERLQKLYDFMVWISLVIAISMTFLSNWVVELLYGGQYNEAGNVLKIHIWAGIFVALGVVRGKWIIVENLQKYTPIYLLIGLILNILFNYFYIPKYGIEGAAYATLIAQAGGTLIAPLFIKETRISFKMMMKSLLLIPSIIKI